MIHLKRLLAGFLSMAAFLGLVLGIILGLVKLGETYPRACDLAAQGLGWLFLVGFVGGLCYVAGRGFYPEDS